MHVIVRVLFDLFIDKERKDAMPALAKKLAEGKLLCR